MSLPTTVTGVIEQLHQVNASLGTDDGVCVFNTVYLTVTEHIGASLQQGGHFRDDAAMAALTVRFAGIWLSAHDAATDDRDIPKAWEPLFSSRHEAGLLPIQFALAGMNTHIEHDLALAVVDTCRAQGTNPDDPTVVADYLRINQELASQESSIRHSFLDEVARAADNHLDPVAHLLSSWSIEKARDVALLNARTIWELRRTPALRSAYLKGLAHTVGMGSRLLLTRVVD